MTAEIDPGDNQETRAQAARIAFQTCLDYLRARDPRATSVLHDLLARFPAFAEGWEQVGAALLDAGQKAAAMVAFHRALDAAPAFERALRCGGALRKAGYPSEAHTMLQGAVKLAPGSAQAWFGLALCEQDLGHFGPAAEAYRQAIACEPALAEAHVNLGTVLQATGDLDGARAAYGRGLAIRSDAFGRVAQALAAEPQGELWLDLEALRHTLRA